MVKNFLVPGVKNIGFPVAPISFCIHRSSRLLVFYYFWTLDDFLTVFLALLSSTLLTILLLLVLNAFRANISDNLIIFNIEVSNIF